MAAPGVLAALGLLAAALAATSPRQGPAPAAAPAPPPFRNLRLDPDELRLSWDRAAPGPRAACQKDGAGTVWAEAERCTFPSLSACHVTNLSVFLVDDPDAGAWVLFPTADPHRASAASDLRCRVHDVERMTCRWGRGPGAPPDVQYRMFYRPASLGRDRDRECPHYDLADGRGLRLGCRLDDVSRLPGLVTVTVTGSSRRGPVGCSDAAVDLPGAEILAPPTLAAACNGSAEALVRWEARSLFHREFRFQLQVNKSSRSEPEVQEWTAERHFRVLNPGAVSFRVRAKVGDDAVPVSAWSAAAALDCRPGRGHVTALTGGLAGLGAGLALLALLLLLCRRPLKRKLFPPIPRMKDPVGERAGPAGEPVSWTAPPEDCPVTHVTEA